MQMFKLCGIGWNFAVEGSQRKNRARSQALAIISTLMQAAGEQCVLSSIESCQRRRCLQECLQRQRLQERLQRQRKRSAGAPALAINSHSDAGCRNPGCGFEHRELSEEEAVARASRPSACYRFNSDAGCKNAGCIFEHRELTEEDVVARAPAAPVKCTYCWKTGHSMAVCRKRVADDIQHAKRRWSGFRPILGCGKCIYYGAYAYPAQCAA